jgi:hypothetical protein
MRALRSGISTEATMAPLAIDIDVTAVADHLRAILAAMPASDDSPRDRPTLHRLQGCVADRVLVARRRRSAQWRTGARTHPGVLTE